MKNLAAEGANSWTPVALISLARARLAGSFARRFATLAVLTAAGQSAFVVALPLLSRIYSPSDFGVFAIYLSIVNLTGPLLSLRFESALYAEPSREAAARVLLLALVTVCATGGLSCAGVWMFQGAILSAASGWNAGLVYALPVGMLLAGAWSVSSAWAVRIEASSTLGLARFVQPALMTVLQIGAGFVAPSGAALVGAHLLSHLTYSSLIALREIKSDDISVMRTVTLDQLLKLGVRNRKFVYFTLPAQISTLSVSNLPPLLLSWFYGAGLAGHYAVAYRLIIAPLTIASMPLGAIFTGSLVRLGARRDRSLLVRRVFLVNLVLVSAPILLLGTVFAPWAPTVLGANWALTGQIVAALSVLGAAQALATPFSEATSVMAAQGLRLLIDGTAATLVIGVVIAGGASGMSPVTVIWIMSAGGALLSLAGLAVVMRRIENRSTDVATDAVRVSNESSGPDS